MGVQQLRSPQDEQGAEKLPSPYRPMPVSSRRNGPRVARRVRIDRTVATEAPPVLGTSRTSTSTAAAASRPGITLTANNQR